MSAPGAGNFAGPFGVPPRRSPGRWRGLPAGPGAAQTSGRPGRPGRTGGALLARGHRPTAPGGRRASSGKPSPCGGLGHALHRVPPLRRRRCRAFPNAAGPPRPHAGRERPSRRLVPGAGGGAAGTGPRRPASRGRGGEGRRPRRSRPVLFSRKRVTGAEGRPRGGGAPGWRGPRDGVAPGPAPAPRVPGPPTAARPLPPAPATTKG